MPKPTRLIQLVLLLLVLALAGYFRFSNLAENPGWYNDEGTNINIANNLLAGRSEYLGIQDSMLIVGRVPLFTGLLSLAFQLFDTGLETLRFLTAAAGVLSVGLLFLVLIPMAGREQPYIPFLAALTLAVHPKAVLFSRIGFGYSLLMPLAILAFYGLWLYLLRDQKRGLILALIATSTGILVELAFMAFSFAVALAVLVKSRRHALWAIPVLYGPFLIHCLLSYARFGESFGFDFWLTFSRSGSAILLLQPINILFNLTHLIVQDPVFLFGLFGLLLVRPLALSGMALAAFFIPFVVIARNFGMTGQGYYYISPFFPFIAMGMAYAAMHGFQLIGAYGSQVLDGLATRVRRPVLARYGRVLATDAAILLLVVFPLAYALVMLNIQVREGFATSFDSYFLDASDSRQAAEYVNSHSRPDDLVIASPALAWALEANATDYQIALAAQPAATIHFPAGIPAERMAFDTDTRNARFIIVDNIWTSWSEGEIPGLTALREYAESWPLALQAGEIKVYRNPASP